MGAAGPIAERRPRSSLERGVGQEVGHPGRFGAAVEGAHALLQPPVLDGDALVLAQVVEPALEQERLHPPARVRGVGEELPEEGAVARALLAQRRQRLAECGVVGAPCPERGQIVKAYIVLRAGHAGDAALTKALQDYVKAEIAPYKYPRAIEYVTELPRTETGKLQRFRLRDVAAETANKNKLAS